MEVSKQLSIITWVFLESLYEGKLKNNSPHWFLTAALKTLLQLWLPYKRIKMSSEMFAEVMGKLNFF